MGLMTILIIWPRFGKQTSLNDWSTIWILALIGPVVTEWKSFEEFSPYEFM